MQMKKGWIASWIALAVIAVLIIFQTGLILGEKSEGERAEKQTEESRSITDKIAVINLDMGANNRGVHENCQNDAGEPDDNRLAGIVADSLAAVGLPGTQAKMPSELSGGMRKRAALARSIAGSPEVILYDEPTTGLDPIMSDAIADLVRETHAALAGRHVTSIIVTHDIKVALKTGDRLVMLYNGRVVGEGPPEMFRRLLETDLAPDAPEGERMIQQFVRGEASGPIQAVVLPGAEGETRTVVRAR